MKKAVGLAVLAFLLVAAVFVWDYLSREARHREELHKLQEVVKRLTAERRVAQVVVRARITDSEGNTRTDLDFIEWDRAGKPLPPVIASLPGTEVYFEALVIKFKNEYVEKGDALRGASLILFRRIFGSSQAPEVGVPVDSQAEDGIPEIYRVDQKPSPFELNLWKRFWYYADHPEEASKLGVRVIQCEAVGGRLQANRVYELSVEADGGLNLIPTTPETE
jgi:hypothetical protein